MEVERLDGEKFELASPELCWLLVAVEVMIGI